MTAAGLSAALKLIELEEPDLSLLDLALPETSSGSAGAHAGAHHRADHRAG